MQKLWIISLLAVTVCGSEKPVAISTPKSTTHKLQLPSETYSETRAKIETVRAGLASSPTAEVSERFHAAIIDDLSPHWMGTPWDFNGITQIPGEGQIACGYFVSTLLRDAGLDVSRVKMGQKASLHIMKDLIVDEKKLISITAGLSLGDFLERVKKAGDGLYVLGLDYHVGFLSVRNDQMHFVHSAYYGKKHVVSEPAASSPALASSNYRAFGNLTADPDLMKKWVRKTPIR